MDFFYFFSQIETFFWGYVAFALIMTLGAYFSYRHRFFQIFEILNIRKSFAEMIKAKTSCSRGVHPLRAFFASTGGMIGIGNVVGIVTAVQIGGPGALFWVWVAGLLGSIIKYSEVYLGLKYRVENGRGGYDGGPMYFLKAAFGKSSIPLFVALLLCIYGVEIYQFSVVTDSVTNNFGVPRFLVIGVLLTLVLYCSLGGVKRIGKISAILLPTFLVIYLLMALFIILSNLPIIPSILGTVFKSAFSGHAALGGFAGSSMLLAIQHGLSRAAYSADIGIGYDSILHSESNVKRPEEQARLAILGVFIDNMICTCSIILVLISGVWYSATPVPGSEVVQTALSQYFPYMGIFMPLFITILGFTTLNAYFCVGIKCARFIFPKRGQILYIIYGVSSFILFAFVDQARAQLVMSLSGSMLLILNVLGIFCLRRVINIPSFETKKQLISE